MAARDLEKYLTDALSRRGPQQLPYSEDAKYTIRQHLTDLSQELPSLHIADEDFTYDDGRCIHALKAHGTIPMYYQGSKYNIPVAVWLGEDYPRMPPIVYVEPTPDMIIKPRHTFVNASGSVDISYLREWTYQRSNLVDLCWTLGISFGEDPPLFSKPPGWTPPPVPAPRPPPPARPPQQPFHNPMNGPPPLNPYAQPPPGPRPPGPPADPYANPIAFHNPYAVQQQPPPPRPEYPQPPPPQRPAAMPNPYATAQPPPPPPPQQQQQPPPPPTPPRPQEVNPAELAFRQAAIASLTERLKLSIASQQETVKRELSQLREVGAELDSRHSKLMEGFNAMEAERTALERNVGAMSAKTSELDGWLARHEGKAKSLGELNSSEVLEGAIQPVDGLSRQALMAAAEDVAIEDTLYALERALQAGILEPELYLKQVRKICRKQFFPRALAMKIAGVQQAQRQQETGSGARSDSSANGKDALEMSLPQGDSWVQSSGHFQRAGDGAAAVGGAGWSNPMMRS